MHYTGSRYISRRYLYGHNPIRQVLNIDSQLSTNYFGLDGHGNVRFLFSSAGDITDTYTFDAFGILIGQDHAAGATPNRHLYCGEQFDSDLGLYYLRARYCSPESGTFWTMDIYEGTQSDPPSLHKYLYCRANPVSCVDPSGRDIGDLVTALNIGGIMLSSMGHPVIGGVLMSVSRPRRHLTQGEIQLARSIFGGKIDYSKVYIVKGKWVPVQAYDRPMAPDGSIYISTATGPNGSAYSKDYSAVIAPALGPTLLYSQAGFIHEMTHVWQHQIGIWVKLDWVMERDWRDSSYDYDLSTFGTIDFKQYRIEEEAQIVQDFYILLRGGSIYRNGSPVTNHPPLQSYQVVTGKYFP